MLAARNRGAVALENEVSAKQPIRDPVRSWIDLSPETNQFGARRAYVNLVATPDDMALWTRMDQATFTLAAALAGKDPKNIEYLDRRTGAWLATPPTPDATGGGAWRDGLGSTHHEAGPLAMGAPGTSLTDTAGRFHHLANAYVAGPRCSRPSVRRTRH